MKKTNTLLKGTFYLTITGLISRVIGFFYRIFLSHTIGAEGVGIYQMIFPIYTLCFSFSAAGIQTAISRLTAEKYALNQPCAAKRVLLLGISLSLILSLSCSILIYEQASFFSISILGDERCISLLKILSYSLPFASLHSCINGYYYGMKKAVIPSIAQLLEQIIRVGGVYLLYIICLNNNQPITTSIAVWGLVFGEIASMLFSITAVSLSTKKLFWGSFKQSYSFDYLRQIMTLSVPLTANRVFLNLFHSAEAILIPLRLRASGLNNSEALSIYGVLTGMAFPLIFFPCVITNSVSVMLLPTVAEAQAQNKITVIAKTIEETIKYSLLLGILSTGIFLSFGNAMGILIFNSAQAGIFITILAWICPFLYLTTTLNSILLGLGKTTTSFVLNMITDIIRIGFVLFLIPSFGISGYLWGMLFTQLGCTFASVYFLKRTIPFQFQLDIWVIKPLLALLFCFFSAYILNANADYTCMSAKGLITIFINCVVFCVLYGLTLILLKVLPKNPH